MVSLQTMLIVETPIFTRLVRELMSDDEYRLLQAYLDDHPEAGAVIRGSGGLRKARWSAAGRGKRGGVRVIYYWAKDRDRLLMLPVYSKAEQNDLPSSELKFLRRVVEEELR